MLNIGGMRLPPSFATEDEASGASDSQPQCLKRDEPWREDHEGPYPGKSNYCNGTNNSFQS